MDEKKILEARIYVHKLSNGTRYIRPEVKDEIQPKLQMEWQYIRLKHKDRIKPNKAYPSKAQDEMKAVIVQILDELRTKQHNNSLFEWEITEKSYQGR